MSETEKKVSTKEQIKYKDGYIFVDVSYLVFYRYFALKRWFSFAHKDIVIENDKWLDNKEFMEKFKKTLQDTVFKIAKNKKFILVKLFLLLIVIIKIFGVYRLLNHIIIHLKLKMII